MLKQQKEKKKDNDPSYVILRRLSLKIVNVLAKTSITPNQITVGGFIIFTPLIIYFFIRGSRIDNLIALGFIFISVVIDLCDGTLARVKSMQSNFGQWLDGSLDKMFQLMIFIAIVIGIVLKTHNDLWYIVGIILLFGQSMADYMGFCYEKLGFDFYSGSKDFNSKFTNLKKISFLDSFLKNIIVPSNLFYIFFFTCRYLLLLGVLLNRLDIFLIVFAITINIRWLTMYFLYLRYLYPVESKLYTIKFLRELYFKK